MQQKVQFISTMLYDPDLVILDEPFSGLDPVNAQVMKDTVLALRRRGKTILFSTHIMEQAEKLCDELCIIARGKKLVDGALSDIKRTRGGHHLVIGFDGSAGGAQQVFADKGLVKRVDDYGQYAELELAAGADAQQILQRLVASGARLSGGASVEDSLAREVGLKSIDGFLVLSDSLTQTGVAQYRASNVSSLDDIGLLRETLGRLAERARLERAGVDPTMVARAQIRVSLDTKKITGGRTTEESAGQSFSLAYFMMLILYISLLLYGVQVMGSVIEEKTSRVIEVLVSSLKPFQLLLGKLLGVGAVSLVQFAIWGMSGRLLLGQRAALVSRMGGVDPEVGQVFQVPHVSGVTAPGFS